MGQHQNPVQSICLNMIVKNETKVITRCLESCKPVISCVSIMDTGSTDDTPGLIKAWCASNNVDCTVHEAPWVDFGTNRTQSFQHAQRDYPNASYMLFIDADEQIEVLPGFKMPYLSVDAYAMEVKNGGLVYHRVSLVNATKPWTYVYPMHEVLSLEGGAFKVAMLSKIRTVVNHDGARSSDPEKFLKDAVVLEKYLSDHPNDPRATFYLAQCYKDGKNFKEALRFYLLRAKMTEGWHDEVFVSLYNVALLTQGEIGKSAPDPSTLHWYQMAFNTDPTRKEPLYRLGLLYQFANMPAVALIYFGHAMRLAEPKSNQLFVEWQVSRWYLPLNYAVCLHNVGQYSEAYRVNQMLLQDHEMPADIKEKVAINAASNKMAMEGKIN